MTLRPDTAVQTASFSADDIPQHHRNEFVHDFYGRIQMRLQIEPDPEHLLRFNAKTLILPDMTCTIGSTSPMTWERNSELMADSNDDVIISWNRGGYRFHMLGRGDFETKPGTAAILPLDRRFSITTRDSAWTMALQFKRSLLAPFVKDIDDVGFDSIGRLLPAHCLLHDYLWSLTHMAAPSALAPLASRHIVDLLAASFQTDGPTSAAPGVRAARLATLKQYIVRNLFEPDISAEKASKAFAISARYIRQLFSEEGTSFSDYVTEKRLSYIHACLRDSRQMMRSVSDIAFEAGFMEPSTFYRRFRNRYGVTPSDVRKSVADRARG